jgi:hypothetical protein
MDREAFYLCCTTSKLRKKRGCHLKACSLKNTLLHSFSELWVQFNLGRPVTFLATVTRQSKLYAKKAQAGSDKVKVTHLTFYYE